MTWLLGGQLAVGLLAGLLTGLSQSPVVGAVLPGILTLAGGSVLALSVAEATSDADQQLLGQQMLAVVIGTAIGVFVGLCLVSRNIKLPILRP
jgi:FtsH-binding integral membrane protein